MCTDVQMAGSMDGLGLARGARSSRCRVKRPASRDLSPGRRIFGKPLEAGKLIVEVHSMIGRA
jgi:hypothetical protein